MSLVRCHAPVCAKVVDNLADEYAEHAQRRRHLADDDDAGAESRAPPHRIEHSTIAAERDDHIGLVFIILSVFPGQTLQGFLRFRALRGGGSSECWKLTGSLSESSWVMVMESK